MKKVALILSTIIISSCSSNSTSPSQSIKETENGLYLTTQYSEYQFIPNETVVSNVCNDHIINLANKEASIRKKTIEPSSLDSGHINVNRDTLTGITSCSASLMVQWTENSIKKADFGAFGLHNDLSKKDVIKKGIVLFNKKNNSYSSFSTPIENKLFTSYIYTFNTTEDKLCSITGFTNPIETDSGGAEAQKIIYMLRDILENKYGSGFFLDESKGAYKKDWANTLKKYKTARVFSYVWTESITHNINSDYGISLIVLYPFISPQNKNNTIIAVDYSLDSDLDCASKANINMYKKGL
ncbi:hypothetical protein DM558_00325 [Entomomonas moraniae]|uniref:Uncharacterized protein n=1 Tax=Entomomonas moraniae TaxID=2213226 RepID=A0A3Q9JJR5_9GAMM|nr:hypothetical protein [Entomomonas moraniae]AZS49315.1 hypothetical protein DM558_00325 [Entomomonas moraniae]